ncbi:MAG: hypothetical protein QGF00_22145 [Planctomycetota bacterium]|jgi:hypothetical protein|nr:hypothetical protein [Planctomycetota bacterium]
MNELRALGSGALTDLHDLLDHHVEGVRWSAARLLTELADETSLPTLAKYREDLHIGSQVEDAIFAIEEKVGGKAEEQENVDTREMGNEQIMRLAVDGTNWQLSEDSPLQFTVTVALPENRRQNVHCIFQEESDEQSTPLTLVYTECGPANENAYEWALRLNTKLPFGAVGLREVDGKLLFVMVNSFMRETVRPIELQKSIARLAKEADALEKKLTGGEDQY